MRLIFKHFPIFFSLNLSKLRFAYGVSSIVPKRKISPEGQQPNQSSMPELHYQLLDCDGKQPDDVYYWLLKNEEEPFIVYQTPHGVHAIVYNPLPFPECAAAMLRVPFADKSHISIGLKRGYWFLEQKIPVFFSRSLPMIFMRIERT